MSVSFVKLFTTLTDSSVWALPDNQRVIWITMLSMANARGNVHASVLGIAGRARKSIEEVEEAIAVFMAPDPYSRTKTLDGRRLEEIPGGWHFVTYQVHKSALEVEKERERKRKWWQENRGSESVPETSAKLDKTSGPDPKLDGLDGGESRSGVGSTVKLDGLDELAQTRIYPDLIPPGFRSDPDPDLDPTRARDRQAPTPAQGEPHVWFTLDGWEMSAELRDEAVIAGVPPGTIDERIKALRNGPIGGKRGVISRDEYVRSQFPRWKTWAETDRHARTGRDRPNQPNAGVTGYENATVIE
jgi:hypothetical protein